MIDPTTDSTNSQVAPIDTFVYRTVVIALAAALILTISGMVGLGIAGRAIPDALVAFGSAAIGALASLLVPAPNQRN